MQITWKSVLGTGVAGLVVSMSAPRALASSAGCPPEDDARAKAQTLRVLRPSGEPSLADTHLVFGDDGAPQTTTLRRSDLAPLTVLARPRMVQPLQLDGATTLRPTLVRPGGAGGATLLQPEGGPRRVRALTASGSGAADSGSTASIVIVEDDDTVSIKIENGKIVGVERNGKKVPLDRVKRDGDSVKIVDENGDVVFEKQVSIGGDGQGTWVGGLSGDPTGMTRLRMLGRPGGEAGTFLLRPGQDMGGVVQAEEPKVMIGVQLAEPDRSLIGHFDLKAGEATLVSAVYEGLPADDAGLAPYDLIVSVDGEESAGQAVVRKILRDKDEGGVVALKIIHRGQKKDVKIKVVKYDADKLQNAKVNSIAADAFTAWESGAEGLNRVFVAPGQGFNFTFPQVDQWRNFQNLPPETQEKMKEEWKVEVDRHLKSGAEAKELLGRAMRDRAAAEGAGPGGSDRLRGIEDRMERLEKAIQKMIERREKENQHGSDNNPERHA